MKLIDYLESRGFTDAEYADKVGVDRSTIGRVSRGVVQPSWSLMEAIYQETKGLVTPTDFLRKLKVSRRHRRRAA